MSELREPSPPQRQAMFWARSKWALVWTGLLLVAGCASPPPPRAMVIIPSAPFAVNTKGEAPRAPGVALAPVRLPEHWQRRQVLHLRHDTELVAWPNAVWAERVETGMTRRLSQALRQKVPELGWWTGEDALGARRLLVEVQQLEVHPGRGEVVGTLNWRLVDRLGRVLDGGSQSDRLGAPIGDAQQEAEALARWLDAQAEVLASRVRNLPAP